MPPDWAARAVRGFLVALHPEEVTLLKGPCKPDQDVDPEDQRLASLVAAGLRPQSIADELGISLRTTHRRLGKLRRRWKVSSTTELATTLRRNGFG